MKTSVILCTYNRCGLLSRALDSVLNSELPESYQWELLVVDNNSSDKTRAVVDSYRTRFPNLRYIFEVRQGKSHALNRGLQEAKGDILAFMDDDVQVDPQWLSKISAPFHAGSWAGVGGRILPPRDFSAPAWLPLAGQYSLGGILAFFDFGDAPNELREPPFGTNMAFRKSIFEKYGAFRLDLGPCPGTEIRGEDTEFGRRILKAGERLWYEPAAVVYHEVPKNRLDKGYFQRFLYDHGRASIREKKIGQPVFLIPRLYFTIPKIILGSLLPRITVWLFSVNPQRRFQRKCMAWMNIGQIVEICHSLSGRGSNAGGRPAPLMNGKENGA